MSELPVSKEAFVKASGDERWELLYDLIRFNAEETRDSAIEVAECTAVRVLGCGKRFDKIEKRNFIEKAVIAVVAAVAATYGYFK